MSTEFALLTLRLMRRQEHASAGWQVPPALVTDVALARGWMQLDPDGPIFDEAGVSYSVTAEGARVARSEWTQ